MLLLIATSCAPRSGASAAAGAGSPPLRFGDERVLVLPVQNVGAAIDAARLDAEIAFALRERAPGVAWVGAAELRRALRLAPSLAADPSALPADPLVHHGERRMGDALAAEVRRYSALVDARLVLLPRLRPAPGREHGEPRFGAALVDARTAGVVWWAEFEATDASAAGAAALAEWAELLARRLVDVADAGRAR